MEATPELTAFWHAPTDPQALAEAMRPLTAGRLAPPTQAVMARWSAFTDSAYAAWFNQALALPTQCLAAVALTADEALRIDTPIRLLHGLQDRACPPEPLTRLVLDHLPRADLLLLGACGHNVIAERTAEVVAAVSQLTRKGLRA